MRDTTKMLAVLIGLLFCFSCSNDSEDDLSPQTVLPITVSYNTTIKNIVDNTCNNCHGTPLQNGAPIPLTTYNQVKNAVQNNNLIGRLKSTTNPMPPGGNLPTSTIDLFDQWLANGLPE